VARAGGGASDRQTEGGGKGDAEDRWDGAEVLYPV
jgi:hypothetical protein